MCATLQGNPGSKIQEGWPLPSRDSSQTLDKANHGNQICAPSRSMTGHLTDLQPRSVAVRYGHVELVNTQHANKILIKRKKIDILTKGKTDSM